MVCRSVDWPRMEDFPDAYDDVWRSGDAAMRYFDTVAASVHFAVFFGLLCRYFEKNATNSLRCCILRT